MVDKFKLILEQIRREKGDVNLFAVLKMDEITDKWTVLLSAPWIQETNLSNNFIYLRGLVINNFNEEQLSMVAKIVVSTKDEHIVEELMKFTAGSVINGDQRINGNIVHEAYILASNSAI